MTHCAEEFGGLDVVVANVSALAIPGSEENWEASFRTDMLGTVRLVEAALPSLEASDRGAIVTVSSVSGREIDFAAGPYGTMKGAIVHYTQGLAYQLAGRVRANTVSPGNTYFSGGVWESIEQGDPDLYAHALSLNPTGPDGPARGDRPGRRLPREPGRVVRQRDQPRRGRGADARGAAVGRLPAGSGPPSRRRALCPACAPGGGSTSAARASTPRAITSEPLRAAQRAWTAASGPNSRVTTACAAAPTTSTATTTPRAVHSTTTATPRRAADPARAQAEGASVTSAGRSRRARTSAVDVVGACRGAAGRRRVGRAHGGPATREERADVRVARCGDVGGEERRALAEPGDGRRLPGHEPGPVAGRAGLRDPARPRRVGVPGRLVRLVGHGHPLGVSRGVTMRSPTSGPPEPSPTGGSSAGGDQCHPREGVRHAVRRMFPSGHGGRPPTPVAASRCGRCSLTGSPGHRVAPADPPVTASVTVRRRVGARRHRRDGSGAMQ